jgi:hypothetical protein
MSPHPPGWTTLADKPGDVCVRVRTEKGTVFYAGDFIANMPTLTKNLLFKLTDSAPGLEGVPERSGSLATCMAQAHRL